MARVAGTKGHEGITAFVVERGTPGFAVLREIPMLAGHRTYEVVFEDCRIPGSQRLDLGQIYQEPLHRCSWRRRGPTS